MTLPRWFFPLFAACAVALTAAGVYYAARHADVGRFAATVSATGGFIVLDTRAGVACSVDTDNDWTCLPSPAGAPIAPSSSAPAARRP